MTAAKGNGFKAMTLDFNPSTYSGRNTNLNLVVTENTTYRADYDEAIFASRQIAPNLFGVLKKELSGLGFNIRDFGFTRY